MAGKKKAAKSAKAKKNAAVAKKRGRPPKVVKLRAIENENSQAMRELHAQEAAVEADIKEFPYVYRVILLHTNGHYCIDSFKNLEAAQECMEANKQVNSYDWQIIMEKRGGLFRRGVEAYDAW